MERNLENLIHFLPQFILGVVFLIISTYCAGCLLLYYQQSKYLFFPSPVIEKTPSAYNVPFEDVWLPVKVGRKKNEQKVERIHGWWMNNPNSDGKVLLYLHGNTLNIAANLYAATGYYKAGFSVLLIDYRGFGKSEGSFPNEARVYEDAETAWNYLVKQRKISSNQIYIYGHSLGGAIAIDLAVKCPDAAGLIVESTFTSVSEVIAARKLFPFFPVDLILTQQFDSLQKVPKLKIPILIIHGTEDETIPVWMSQTLYASAPQPKELILVSGANHNNVGEISPLQYTKAVQSFLQVVRKRTQATTY
ncbi:MAG: alpha/beta hydrolase [Calothrix sp. CSU_2_0]|nr:alpha/beta hydrolase [Calothrix sp. CSU_2_0]